MLLAADVGNTQTVYGLYEGDRLVDHFRVATERRRTADELTVLIEGLLELDTVDGFCLSSTVPALQREYEEFAQRAGLPILVVGPGVSTGISIRYDDPREVGPDRIVNSVAAKERYGAPVIVVDFGTSTNFDVVSPAGEYVGGVIAPGIEISMDALFARASTAIDPKAAQAGYSRLQQILTRDVAMLWVFERDPMLYYNRRVHDLVSGPNGPTDGFGRTWLDRSA